jgi:hypothetical protein
MMRVRLDASTIDDLSLSSARLVFQEKIMLEELKIWVHGEIRLALMDEDDNLKN